MMRVKMELRFDGSLFNGFQDQNNQSIPTVAATLNRALKRLGILEACVGSGRTDAGVHALRQVVHVDLPKHWSDLTKLRFVLNHMIAPSLFITRITRVSQDFHARFDATKRLYRYVLYDGVYEPFLARYALHVKPLDVERLHQLMQHFAGTHSFALLKKEGGGTTGVVRTLFRLGAYRHKEKIILYFLGDAFLRSQIRMMGALLLRVNYGELSLEALLEQRDAKVQHSTTLLPPSGLYLSRIHYAST